MIVGILIPTFNRKVYLETALNSAFAQTYNKIEIIVIDNGSTDGTAEFMARIADPRVSYIKNETNIGMVGSINKAINLFSDKVEWCTILSDDDILDNNFIDKSVRAVIETRAMSIVHSHRIFIDKDGNQMREASIPPREESALEYIKMRANFGRETYLTGVMFNRKAFLAIDGYPVFASGLATDDAFIFALSLRDRLVFERHAIAYIRIHDEAESQVFSDGIIKLQTLKQFGEYCIRVARQSNTLDREKMYQFEKSLNQYLRRLYSFWWLKTAHNTISQGSNDQEQLSQLFSLVRDRKSAFVFRIRFAAACNKFIGVFPERFVTYRGLWELIIKLSSLIK